MNHCKFAILLRYSPRIYLNSIVDSAVTMTLKEHTCFVVWPAFRTSETILWTRFIFGFCSLSRILAHMHKAGIDASFLRLNDGSRPDRRARKRGALCCSSSHTLSQEKFSRAAFDLCLNRELWLSEEIGITSCLLKYAASCSTTCGRSFLL